MANPEPPVEYFFLTKKNVVADAVNPILGIDFLSRHALIIDCANRLLIDSTTNCKISLDRSHKLPVLHKIHFKDFDERAQQILEKYPDVTHLLQLTDST